MKNIFKILLVIFVLQSCYSFRGISLDPALKTFYIPNMNMQAAGAPPNLSLEFTEKLREYFQRNTSLKVNVQKPDLLFEGTITGYEMVPQAPTSSDKAGLNRLIVRVQMKVTNAQSEEKGYDQEFSFFQDFPQNQSLTQVERELYPRILDQLTIEIFNKTAGDW
jgi:Lipopolysaccharide-assembly